MKKDLLCTLLCTLMLTPALATAAPLHPTKTTAADVNGAIFSRPDAVHANEYHTQTVDVVTYESKDAIFQTGMYKSGPMREELKAPGTPYDEFLHFTAGSVTLTSSDGSVITVKAGESVTLPKGWTGIFETTGYEKIYAIYNPAAKKP